MHVAFFFKASAAFLDINGSLEKSTSLLIKGNRWATPDPLAPSYIKKQQSLLSSTAWYQDLWEDTALPAKAKISQRSTRAGTGPSQAAASPRTSTLHSASITTAAVVPSDLEWFKHS